jgi:hypothetical protein
MKNTHISHQHILNILICTLIILGTTLGCSLPATTPSHNPTIANSALPSNTSTVTKVYKSPSLDLTAEETATLSSLELVDDYPLYTMRYRGTYDQQIVSIDQGSYPLTEGKTKLATDIRLNLNPGITWACSLFAAFGDPELMIYGRNFDWEFSPAMLLFTNPPDAYASVSMVDIAYLGYQGDRAKTLLDLTLDERTGLLNAPSLPFDGMNEHGLVVGMAAVPPGGMQPDPNKRSIGSLGVIRKMLDHARGVEDALAILGTYNINFNGGPPIHYLIADASGDAVLVEFYQGEMVVIPNGYPWHAATNFLLSSLDGSTGTSCSRFDHIHQRMQENKGRLTSQEAMDLLSEVSQANTQWSIVYGINNSEVSLVLGREYQVVHTFQLNPTVK